MVDAREPTVALALAASLGLVLMVVVAGHVGEEIHGPTDQLLGKKVDGGHNGGFLRQLVELVEGLAQTRCILFAGLGHKDHVPSNVARGLVMLAVRDLPREVRHEQGRMANPTDGVVQLLGRREGLVTTLVGQHPDPGTEQPLGYCVQRPQQDPSCVIGHRLRGHIVVEHIKHGRENEQIPSNVRQTPDGRPLIAVGRNGIPNLLDGVVGKLKLVAIGIQHLSTIVVILHLRGHGR